MIAKVVLGVALALIECSFIANSQNSSLSANNDTFNPPNATVDVSNFSLSETSTTDFPLTETSPASITNSDMSTTIKLKTISNFTTTLSPDTSTKQQMEATTVALATANFQLPENCSAYKVRFVAFAKWVFPSSFHYAHFLLSF